MEVGTAEHLAWTVTLGVLNPPVKVVGLGTTEHLELVSEADSHSSSARFGPEEYLRAFLPGTVAEFEDSEACAVGLDRMPHLEELLRVVARAEPRRRRSTPGNGFARQLLEEPGGQLVVKTVNEAVARSEDRSDTKLDEERQKWATQHANDLAARDVAHALELANRDAVHARELAKREEVFASESAKRKAWEADLEAHVANAVRVALDAQAGGAIASAVQVAVSKAGRQERQWLESELGKTEAKVDAIGACVIACSAQIFLAQQERFNEGLENATPLEVELVPVSEELQRAGVVSILARPGTNPDVVQKLLQAAGGGDVPRYLPRQLLVTASQAEALQFVVNQGELGAKYMGLGVTPSARGKLSSLLLFWGRVFGSDRRNATRFVS